MTTGVYLITNRVNGKQYVGQSVNIEGRIKGHLKGKGRAPYLANAIQKYGPANFTWEILVVCSEAELFDRENEFIHWYNPAYNLMREGESTGVHRHAESSKQKVRVASLKWASDHPGFNKGRIASEETRQKIAAARRGRLISEETRQKISAALMGHGTTEEARQKIIASNIGNTNAQGHRYTVSEENKQKLSISKKHWWNKKKAENESE